MTPPINDDVCRPVVLRLRPADADVRDICAGKQPHLLFAHASSAGSDDCYASSKENQDACIEKQIPWQTDKRKTQHCTLFAVLDGHGHDGGEVARYVSKNLPKAIAKNRKNHGASMESILYQSFAECNQQLVECSSIDCSMSGSTCALAAVTGGRLTVCNLGDSKCILGKVHPSGKCDAYDMTNEHNPTILAEANRILAQGGRIASYMIGDQSVGPLRVWLSDKNAPGLSMTRSFGDNLAASVGVIHCPEIVEIDLTAEDRYLVLMSDGISDMMDSDEIIQFVHDSAKSKKSAKQISEGLVQEARHRWKMSNLGVIDDCTAMVVFMGTSGKDMSTHSRMRTGGSMLSRPDTYDPEACTDQDR